MLMLGSLGRKHGKLLSTGNIGETAFTQTGTRTMNGYYVGGADGHRR